MSVEFNPESAAETLAAWDDADLMALVESAPDDPAIDIAKAELDRRRSTPAMGIVRVADVEPIEVSWLWRNYLPLQYVAIVDGDSGLGKSTILLDIAARLTTGREMPDGSESGEDGRHAVLIVNAEDVVGATTRPRLEAAGADLTLCYVATGVDDGEGNLRPFSLPTDAEWLEHQIVATGARMVIIDPLSGHLDARVDMHKDQSVRRAMAPLAAIAERCNCAIVCVRHLSKHGDSRALHRGMGSAAISASARVGLIVAADPDDETGERRILAAAKSNLGPMPRSMAFKLVEVESGSVARVEWLGTVSQRADDLLAAQLDGEERSAIDEACDLLRNLLADGPAASRDVAREASDLGISKRTLKRAQKRMGVEAYREGGEGKGGGRWMLRMIKGANKNLGTHNDSDPSESASESGNIKGATLRVPTPLGTLNNGEIPDVIREVQSWPDDLLDERHGAFNVRHWLYQWRRDDPAAKALAIEQIEQILAGNAS